MALDHSQGFVERCSCSDMPYLCKHIFPVSRTQAIPYSGKSAFSHRPVEEVDGSGDEAIDITKNEGDYQAILREQQRLLRVNTLSESLEQAYADLGAQIKELNKSSQGDPDFLEPLLQEVKNLTFTIENTRNPDQHSSTQRG